MDRSGSGFSNLLDLGNCAKNSLDFGVVIPLTLRRWKSSEAFLLWKHGCGQIQSWCGDNLKEFFCACVVFSYADSFRFWNPIFSMLVWPVLLHSFSFHFFHSFYSFINWKIFIQPLLCTRWSVFHWGYHCEQTQMSSLSLHFGEGGGH